MLIKVRETPNSKGVTVDRTVQWKHTPKDGPERVFTITKEPVDVPAEIGRAILSMRSAEVEEVIEKIVEDGKVPCPKCGKRFHPLGLPGHAKSHKK